MIDAADAVVVGSGAFGSSVAYHLARHGLQVALLDRSRLASQTSPRAAGLTSQVRATPALTAIARRAVVKLATFTDETGQPLRFTQSGALKIARNERDAAQLGREVERGREAGIAIDFVSTAEARRRLPILRERGIAAVTWSPTDCNVEPSELPIGYCRAAEKIGVTLLPHTPAIGFEIGPRGVEGVRTPQGTIATRVVVDAAGAWSRVVAESLGASLQVVAAALAPAFEMADLPLDIEVLRRLAASVADQFPIFQDSAIRIAEYRGGLPMLTTDDRYLVGPLPGIAGAWVMSGCCVGGLSASPALGEALAEWIVDGTSEIDLSEISTARFAGREIDEAELRERCRRAYATHYRADRD